MPRLQILAGAVAVLVLGVAAAAHLNPSFACDDLDDRFPCTMTRRGVRHRGSRGRARFPDFAPP